MELFFPGFILPIFITSHDVSTIHGLCIQTFVLSLEQGDQRDLYSGPLLEDEHATLYTG